MNLDVQIHRIWHIILSSTYYITNLPALKQKSQTNEFQEWVDRYGFSYSSQMEKFYRRAIFNRNLHSIAVHNNNIHRTYDQGVNQFTALTNSQFISVYLTLKINKISLVQFYTQTKSIHPNIQIDWVSQGAVTPVKNEGQCGACWAFSAVGAVQALSKISYGTLRSLSEQQLMDCSKDYGNYGCSGGWMVNSFQYIRDKGICSDQQYPYKAVQQSCKNCSTVLGISGYTQIKGGCTEVIKALENRPISIAVDATNWGSYKKGILGNCGSSLNHAALLVGIVGGVWKVKEQWGASWGEDGYIRLADGNTCGLCNLASYPNK